MSLGRGLGSLIPQKTIKVADEGILVETGEQVLQIPINQIEPSPDQPRKNFSHLEMEELIGSIKEHGIIQPLILTRISKERYQIIAGERRWRAAKILEMITVPAIIRSVQKNEKLIISLLENIQRKDLNSIEKANGYRRLIDEFNLTQDEVAKKIGKARASVANTLRLLTLPEVIQKAIEEEKITEGHAKAILSIEDEEKQKLLLKRILGLGLTVREAEKIAAGKKIKRRAEIGQEFLEKEKILSQALGTKVKIIKQNKKIKVVIEIYQEEELNSLFNKLVN